MEKLTKEEILALKEDKLRVVVGQALGMVLWNRRAGDCYAFLKAGDDCIPAYWKPVESLSELPEQMRFLISTTTKEVYIDDRTARKAEALLTGEAEQETYIDALMELCRVKPDLVFYDGVLWADYPSLLRFATASPDQKIRAFLMAKLPKAEENNAQ